MAARQYSLTVPAETRSLRTLRAFLTSVLEDSPCDQAEQLVLALDEACSNVIRYRCQTIGDGRIRLSITLGDGVLQIRLGQFCTAQDVEKIKPRDLADVRPGGLGTSFIEQIMDRVAYEEEPGSPGCLALVLEKQFEVGA